MELNIETTYEGRRYSYYLFEAEKLADSCRQILNSVPPEDRETLLKYHELYQKAMDSYSKLSYSIGFQHGLGKKK